MRPTLDWQQPLSAQRPLSVVQITDTHLFAECNKSLLGVPTAASFAAVIEAVRQHQQPDLILVTGDISQDNSLESYQRFSAEMAQFSCPVICIAGNHDDAEGMTTALAPLPHWAVRRVLLPGWQLLLLDSQVEGHTHGLLGDAELDFVREAVAAEPERASMLLLHHPPVAVGCNWLDQHRLRNDEALLALAVELGVRAIVCGHVHQDFRQNYQGVELLATPSSSIQFLPQSVQFALDSRAPGYRTFALWPDGRWQSEVVRLAAGLFTPQMNSSGY